MSTRTVYQCVVCPYVAEKRYSMKRHYAGKSFKVPHSQEDYDRSVLGVTVPVEPVPEVAATQPAPPPPAAPEPVLVPVAGRATAAALDVVREIAGCPSLRAMLLEALALQAATEPAAPFCAEPPALVRAMPEGVRLWRSAVACPTSADGLVDLLVRKHLHAFRNVRRSTESGMLLVARAGGAWELVTGESAAREAIAAVANDLRELSSAESACGDTSLARFGPLMDAFASTMGVQLGWGGVERASASVTAALAARLISGSEGAAAATRAAACP